jgi:hypothetical protein
MFPCPPRGRGEHLCGLLFIAFRYAQAPIEMLFAAFAVPSKAANTFWVLATA